MSADKHNLLLFFERPCEPTFVGRGSSNAVFEMPDTYFTDRYKNIGVKLVSRYGESSKQKISVKKITPPDISDLLKLNRRDQFSVFVPLHRRLAAKLTDIFMGMRGIDDLQAMCCYCRDRINPFLFNYALSVALLHRDDTRDLDLPNFAQVFPEKYIDSTVFAQVREEATIVPEEDRIPIEIPQDYTASDLEVENRLAYFREDLGINLHHWHWHLVYPFEGRRDIVAKDRRGELFYYMHQQIIARYNTERMCNKLMRVKRLIELKQPIEEGYFPKLNSLVASRGWPSRVPNATLQNLNRSVDQINSDIDDLIRWRDRIYDAIHSGIVQGEDGSRIELREENGFDFGIDILGNMIEASTLSPNSALYGNLHNMGHNFIAFCHDPDHKYLESFGVMGDSATAMRDPVFYRWHSLIDDIFQEYKATIPRYTVAQLDYQNIRVSRVEIRTENSGEPNVLQTFWQKSDVDLSRGMDFVPRGPVLVRFTHLQHTPFTYRIQVNNSSNSPRRGTVRIFLAPKFDERGLPMLFRDHRLLFIELDKFTRSFDPGNNEVIRRSDESSVTIPFERTFRNLDTNRPTGGDALAQFNFCGCGWPQHMLIPKGNPEGFPCVLFVMVSNINGDLIEQDVSGECNDAASYCGIKDRRYPDRRSMGYPFDRVPRDGVSTLDEFLTPNMAVQDVTIRFENRTVIREEQQQTRQPQRQQPQQSQQSQRQQTQRQQGQQRPQSRRF